MQTTDDSTALREITAQHTRRVTRPERSGAESKTNARDNSARERTGERADERVTGATQPIAIKRMQTEPRECSLGSAQTGKQRGGGRRAGGRPTDQQTDDTANAYQKETDRRTENESVCFFAPKREKELNCG